MLVTIERNGKKVKVNLTAEQCADLGLTVEDRTDLGGTYYFITFDSKLYQFYVDEYIEAGDPTDITLHEVGNYYVDKVDAEQEAKQLNLILRMRGFAKKENHVRESGNYYLTFDNNGVVEVDRYSFHNRAPIGAPLFSSNEVAERAKAQFKNEVRAAFE